MRHQHYIIKLHELINPNEPLIDDYCFKVVTTLCDSSGYVALESRNYPHHYITFCSNDLIKITKIGDNFWNSTNVSRICWQLEDIFRFNVEAAEKASQQARLEKIGAMFEDPELSDFTITCGGSTFRVHKAIIGAQSSYFRAMFRDAMVEGKNNTADIKERVLAIDTICLNRTCYQSPVNCGVCHFLEDYNSNCSEKRKALGCYIYISLNAKSATAWWYL